MPFSSPDSRPPSGGTVAGVVIGAIAGFVLIALAAFFVYCKEVGKVRAGQPTELHSEPYEEYKCQQQGYYGPPIQRNEAPVARREPSVEMGVEETVDEISQTAQTAHK